MQLPTEELKTRKVYAGYHPVQYAYTQKHVHLISPVQSSNKTKLPTTSLVQSSNHLPSPNFPKKKQHHLKCCVFCFSFFVFIHSPKTSDDGPLEAWVYVTWASYYSGRLLIQLQGPNQVGFGSFWLGWWWWWWWWWTSLCLFFFSGKVNERFTYYPCKSKTIKIIVPTKIMVFSERLLN